jgi:hypothetical protein
MIHERHIKNKNEKNERGVIRRTNSGCRQRAAPQAMLDNSSGHNNGGMSDRRGPLSSSQTSCQPATTMNSRQNHTRANTTTKSKFLDALAHPAAAAAAAAAVHPTAPRRRKRKTLSLIVLTVVCVGVVYYSGTMYDSQDSLILKDGDVDVRIRGSASSRRAARLRSRGGSSPDEQQPQQQQVGVANSLAAFTRMIHRDSSTNDNKSHKNDYMGPSNNNNNLRHSARAASTRRSPSQRAQLLQQRILSCLKAAFVADAASMGTHWIYSPDELASVLKNDKQQPEFHTPPSPKFYSALEFPGHYQNGQSSPYGEQLWFMTEYVATEMAAGSVVNTANAAIPRTLAIEYSNNNNNNNDDDDETSPIHNNQVQSNLPDSIAENLSQAMQEWAETFGGRPDHATLAFLSCRQKKLHAQAAAEADDPADDRVFHKNDDGDNDSNNNNDQYCGAVDDQAHFFIKVIPVTCLYVGHPHRRSYVEQAIRVHQNSDRAVMFGLALSDLLERVLLMDDETSGNNNDSNNRNSEDPDSPNAAAPVSSLQEALDTTLESLEAEDNSWFLHFAASLTQHHQQHEALLEAWNKAKESAEQSMTIEQLAAQVGRSCHMPGALILSLHAIYRAAKLEASNQVIGSSNKKQTKTKKPTSSLTHLHKGYHYYVKALLGTHRDDETKTDDSPASEYIVSAVRDNILAAGDTCSRAIYMAAVLGAAYGDAPRTWWDQLDPNLAQGVETASQIIADATTSRLFPTAR